MRNDGAGIASFWRDGRASRLIPFALWAATAALYLASASFDFADADGAPSRSTSPLAPA
jgi:hypothetical protein